VQNLTALGIGVLLCRPSGSLRVALKTTSRWGRYSIPGTESPSAQRDLRIKGDCCNHTFFSYGSVSSSHARSSAISARSDQSDSRRPSLDDLGCSANARAASANFAKFAARPTTCSPVLRTSFRCRVTRTSSRLLRSPFPLPCISFSHWDMRGSKPAKDRLVAPSVAQTLVAMSLARLRDAHRPH
jgi:hypothetical protein